MIHLKNRVDLPKEQRRKRSETTPTGSSARTAYNLRFLMPARCPRSKPFCCLSANGRTVVGRGGASKRNITTHKKGQDTRGLVAGEQSYVTRPLLQKLPTSPKSAWGITDHGAGAAKPRKSQASKRWKSTHPRPRHDRDFEVAPKLPQP